LKFTKTSHFFQTEVPIGSPYCMRKVQPYRFVPQTSYSVEQFDRRSAAPDFPLRSRFFVRMRMPATGGCGLTRRMRARHLRAAHPSSLLTLMRRQRLPTREVFLG
jgi:hypothetical protein